MYHAIYSESNKILMIRGPMAVVPWN